eukprot:scaffold145022_cov17-Tisochrysis_lutea.AAC.2
MVPYLPSPEQEPNLGQWPRWVGKNKLVKDAELDPALHLGRLPALWLRSMGEKGKEKSMAGNNQRALMKDQTVSDGAIRESCC